MKAPAGSQGGRRRDLLHLGHLAAFRAFCESEGWQEEPARGHYEALRMRRSPVDPPLIVHRKADAVEHYTVWGESARMARRFFAERRRAEGRT